MDPYKLYLLHTGIGVVISAMFAGLFFLAAFLDMRNMNRMREDYLETIEKEYARLRSAEIASAHRRTVSALINLEK